jgi:hypothetical protein
MGYYGFCILRTESPGMNLRHSKPRRARFVILLLFTACIFATGRAQTDCAEGNSPLDNSQPKDITPQQIIDKLGAQETRVKEARSHYIYTQDVMVQTLNGTSVDGQMHEVSTISYDDKGKRLEKVTYAEQSTLRGVQLSADDQDDIRTFMPLILPSEDLPQYTLTYAGQQHVDDLDTYVFHVVAKKEEKGKRYFEGRIWVDNRDFQIVKLCGKSVAEPVHTKKNQPQEIRPTFVGYRIYMNGLWFPAYARVDDTLHFRAESVHIREIVKFKDYKRTDAANAAR